MSGKREDGATAATKPERNLKRLFALSFGLLCVLQVSLNVSLRLILYSQLQTSYNNLADEHQRLLSRCSNTTNRHEQLQHVVHNMSDAVNDLLTKLREIKLQMKRSKVNMSKVPAIKDADYKANKDDGDRHVEEEGCSSLMDKHDLLQTKPGNVTIAGCVYFSGSYYFSFSQKQTWPHCRIHCLDRNADLIVISSRTEQEFARRFNTPAWMGLSDIKAEGQWRWVDEAPLTTEFWMESEPNDESDVDEDCAEITSTDATRSWNDASCRQEKFCICEMEQT